LALGVETKQPMDLASFKRRGICCEGGVDVKEMAKVCEESKSQAIKLLEKA
jgi:hypothetical protein